MPSAHSPLAEADTPDEALRLAQAEHGPDVPVQVRPVRSGGVLGFFATERYVVEPADPATGAEPDLDAALSDLQNLFADDPSSTAPAPVYAAGKGLAAAPRTAAKVAFPQAPKKTPAPADPAGPAGPATPPAPVTTMAAPAASTAGGTASPFAAALARVIHDPEVTAAIQDAVGPTGLPATPAESDHATRPPLALSAALVTDRGPTASAPAPAPVLPHLPRAADPDGLAPRLAALGMPEPFLTDGFLLDAAERGPHAALTRLLRMRLPQPPPLPTDPGSTLLVLGTGTEALTAARTVATSLRVDPTRVYWAASEDLAVLVPAGQRIKSVEDAVRRARLARRGPTVTIVAVDAPLSATGADWVNQVIAAWEPSLVWAAMDATRKPADAARWAGRLPHVDGLVVQHTSDTADPAAFLAAPVAPVMLVDGKRATAAAWASLLCERLDEGH